MTPPRVVLTPEYRLRRKLRLGFNGEERAEVFALLEEVIAKARQEGKESALNSSSKRPTEGGE